MFNGDDVRFMMLNGYDVRFMMFSFLTCFSMSCSCFVTSDTRFRVERLIMIEKRSKISVTVSHFISTETYNIEFIRG